MSAAARKPWPKGTGIFSADPAFRTPAWTSFVSQGNLGGKQPDESKWPAFRDAHPSNRDKPDVLRAKSRSITISNKDDAIRRRKNAKAAI